MSILKNHETLLQVLLFLFIIVSIWLIELRLAMQSLKDKLSHSYVNMSFIVTALPIQLALSLGVLFVSGWVTVHHWGMLYLFPAHQSFWVKYLIGFLLLDLFEYCYHILMHKTSTLWRFHLIHHSDEQIDVSTTLREHPCETMVRVIFLMLWVFLSGASIGLLLLRQTVQTISNLSAHSSYQLPRGMEKIFSLVLITPGLHHIHHHFELPYTDCNYGDVLSIWDRLFGTYCKEIPGAVKFGLDKYQPHSSTHFPTLIKYPFYKADKI